MHCMYLCLKAYQQELWNFIYSLDAFNITLLPRDQNIDVDILANASSILMPLDDGFSVEMMFMSSVLENIKKWRVFDSDTQTISFITRSDTFQDAVIDDDTHQQELQT
jgi:hypothetical protein